MRIGRYQFSPGRIPTLATVVLLPVLIGLGFWQLDRAEQRRALEQAYESREERPTVDLNRERAPSADGPPYNAVAQGRYDADRQLLLDNQTYRGETGYHVLTPVRLRGRDAAVLVDRGWVPAGDSRAELPEVSVPEHPVEVTGYLDDGPPTGIRLGGMAEGETGWPLRIQYLDFDALEERLGYPLVPSVLRLDPEAPHGYTRDWGPAFREGYGPERNQGYALQWFALALALAVIYVTVNTRRMSPDDAQ